MELHLQTSGKTRVVSAIDVVEDKDHGSPPMLISVTLLDPRSLGYRPRASLSQLICWVNHGNRENRWNHQEPVAMVTSVRFRSAPLLFALVRSFTARLPLHYVSAVSIISGGYFGPGYIQASESVALDSLPLVHNFGLVGWLSGATLGVESLRAVVGEGADTT
ncbi:hypothetical protein BD777DRAFT_135541 [Yarrowia lipolytica]|nr:hypothetical protein BD777DRAFT_135541 [Yarrowia lipolytica]